MRMSSDDSDPGYDRRYICSKVFIAGSERWNVITADEEKRWALLIKLDENGTAMRDEQTGKLVTEEFFGEVVIVIANEVQTSFHAIVNFTLNPDD